MVVVVVVVVVGVVGCGSDNGDNINGSLSGTVVKGPLIDEGNVQVFRFTSENGDDLSPILEGSTNSSGKFQFSLGELSI